MSSFEYASVLTSIIVGFALSDMLRSFQALLRERKKVRWDWAAPMLAVLVTFSIIQVWWLLYEPEVGSLTIASFLPVLVLLIVLSVLASAVFPDAVPAEGVDLKSYYADNARFIWTTFAVALIWLTAMDIARLGDMGLPLMTVLVNQLVEVIVLAVMVSLAVVKKRWWHATGFAILASGPLMWLARSVG